MTTTILTMDDKRRIMDSNMLPWHPQVVAAINDAEQAVLQSPEIQELRRDAERWRAMKELSVVTFMNDLGRKLVIATLEVDKFPERLTLEQFIDAAMEKQP